MQRFYKQATVGEPDDDGWPVLLDGRPIRTPGKRTLAVPAKALASAIAAEWDGQAEMIKPFDMHLTRAANTAIDKVVPNRTPIEDALVDFGETDSLCYRVDRPAALAERQQRNWQPLLDWATGRFDCALAVTTGILPQPQRPQTLAALRKALMPFDAFGLAGLHGIAAAARSLVIALAVADRHIDVDTAVAAASLDESDQAEHRSVDAETENRLAMLRTEITTAARFLAALRQHG